MMDSLISQLVGLLQNQFLSGGLLLMVSGSALALCRNVPRRIGQWAKRRFIVSIDIGNDDPLFEWIAIWLSEQPYTQRARILTATTKRDLDGYPERPGESSDSVKTLPTVIFTPAPGNHCFFYKRNFIWLTRERKDAQGGKSESSWSIRRKETFNIRVIGRNQNKARQILNDARALASVDSKPTIDIFISNSSGYWNRVDSRQPRPLSTVFLPDEVTNDMATSAREFLESRSWYVQRGIPFRKGYLFYGVPGSGKTSLISALAGDLKMNLYMLNIGSAELTDDALHELMSHVPARSIVLLEDIDAAFVQREQTGDKMKGVTFSGLLNVLDGASSKEGSMTFMTTNHRERLDPALIRPGRVDVQLHFGHATDAQVLRMYQAFHPHASNDGAQSFLKSLPDEVSMAEVQQRLLEHREIKLHAVA